MKKGDKVKSKDGIEGVFIEDNQLLKGYAVVLVVGNPDRFDDIKVDELETIN